MHNVVIKITSLRRRIGINETVTVIERSYERVQKYRSKEDDGRLGRSGRKLVRTKRSWSYVVCDILTGTIDEMARAADVGMHWSSTAGFVSGLVKFLEVSTMKIFLAVVRKVTLKWGRNVSKAKQQLAFVRSRFVTRGYILTVEDDDSEKDSSASQLILKEEFRRYSQRTGLGFLVIGETVLCLILVVGRRVVAYGLLRYYCCF